MASVADSPSFKKTCSVWRFNSGFDTGTDHFGLGHGRLLLGMPTMYHKRGTRRDPSCNRPVTLQGVGFREVSVWQFRTCYCCAPYYRVSKAYDKVVKEIGDAEGYLKGEREKFRSA